MVNRNLVGRCGIYYGSCIIYRAYRDSSKLRRHVADRNNCKPEAVQCKGCQTVLADGWDKDGKWGKNCKIVRCLEAKKLDFCYECDEYPNCREFRGLANHHLIRYGESLTENLAKIETGKVEKWLSEEAEKWRCHKCGKPISRHLKECHWCGAKIILKARQRN